MLNRPRIGRRGPRKIACFGASELILYHYYGYNRILRKMQKEERDEGPKRDYNEGKGRNKKKGCNWHLSGLRNQDVQDFRQGLDLFPSSL